MNKLMAAIASQQSEVARFQQLVVSARLAWLKTRGHSQSMSKLTARYESEEFSMREQQAQRQADELSGQRFTWRQQAEQDDWQQGAAS
jgi:flagellar export protein FliJ